MTHIFNAMSDPQDITKIKTIKIFEEYCNDIESTLANPEKLRMVGPEGMGLRRKLVGQVVSNLYTFFLKFYD